MKTATATKPVYVQVWESDHAALKEVCKEMGVRRPHAISILLRGWQMLTKEQRLKSFPPS